MGCRLHSLIVMESGYWDFTWGHDFGFVVFTAGTPAYRLRRIWALYLKGWSRNFYTIMMRFGFITDMARRIWNLSHDLSNITHRVKRPESPVGLEIHSWIPTACSSHRVATLHMGGRLFVV